MANFDRYISLDHYSNYMNDDVFLNMHHMGGDAGLRAQFAQYMILQGMQEDYLLLEKDVSAANVLVPNLLYFYLPRFITTDTADEHHLRDILMHFLTFTSSKLSPLRSLNPSFLARNFSPVRKGMEGLRNLAHTETCLSCSTCYRLLPPPYLK